MQQISGDLVRVLGRSLKTFESMLEKRSAVDALDRVLAIGELLRGSRDPELEQIASHSFDYCASLVLAGVERELCAAATRAVAYHWWNLGQRLESTGYVLPDGFATAVLDRAQKVFLRQTIGILAARSREPFDPRLGATSNFRENAVRGVIPDPSDRLLPVRA
jgi:hypothetical protein